MKDFSLQFYSQKVIKKPQADFNNAPAYTACSNTCEEIQPLR